MTNSEMSLYDTNGARKYLTTVELNEFLRAAAHSAPRENAYCQTLARTGGRRAEVLNLRRQDIDRKAEAIVIRTLKKRDKVHHRSIPVPPELLTMLTLVFDLGGRGRPTERLWDVELRTANRWIMKAMAEAGIKNQTPKSLRHTFGVTAACSGVPLTLIQRWLGHADIKTTAIYTQAMGEEERGLAARMWQ
jgi:integrase